MRWLWKKGVRFYRLCERIAAAIGALKVMAIILGGVLLVLAAIALVAALVLGYAVDSLGLLKLGLFVLAAVLAVAGFAFIGVGIKTRSSTHAPAAASALEPSTVRPPELLGFFSLSVLSGDLYMMTLTIKSTLLADLVNPLVNLTMPKNASIFRPCDHNGIERKLGDVKSKGQEWLWTYDQPLIRTKAETEFYFHVERQRSLGAIPVRVEVVHTDLPDGSWVYEAVLGLPAAQQGHVDDLSVEIDREDWDNYKWKARILEIRVKVTNQTDKRKKMTSFAVIVHGGPNTDVSSTGDIELLREVERRKQNHPLLEGVSIIEPDDFARGWMVFPFPWTPDPGPSRYSFIVRDELNIDYAAQGGSALPLPEVDEPASPSEPSEAENVVAELDDIGIYIIRTQREVESKARLDSDFVAGPFAPPPPGVGGRFGPFSNEEARRGFERLRELGVIERESFDTERALTRYRWTDLGRIVAERL